MRFFIGLALALFLIIAPLGAEAAVKVKGYTTNKGRYVPSYYRSSPNTARLDNYSTKGNYNPYTGKTGTKSIYRW